MSKPSDSAMDGAEHRLFGRTHGTDSVKTVAVDLHGEVREVSGWKPAGTRTGDPKGNIER